MYKGKKVISVTPAGRRRYIHLLAMHLLANRDIIDKHIFWLNTNDPKDIDYMYLLAKTYPDFFEVRDIGLKGPPDSSNIHKFFPECTVKDTTYIRFDDDVIWIDKNAVVNLLECRERHPNAPIIFANIINNALCNHLQQRYGNIPLTKKFKADYSCMGNSWADHYYAEYFHKVAISKIKNNQIKDLYFPDWILFLHERMSINCITWEGECFEKFFGQVAYNEEEWLTTTLPEVLNENNVLCGNALVSHYAFCSQRSYMDGTDILSEYFDLCPK